MPIRDTTREDFRLKGECVRAITRDMFPLGKPVVIESFIDTKSGWDFDAPLHFMWPFHRYCETGSICKDAVEAKLEDIFIDLDCGLPMKPCDSAWPYTGRYLTRIFNQIRAGKRRDRFAYYKSTVVVSKWGSDDVHGTECVQYEVSTEEIRQ